MRGRNARRDYIKSCPLSVNRGDMLYLAPCAQPLWSGSDSTCDWPTTQHWRPLPHAAGVSCRYSSGRPRKTATGRLVLRAAGGCINPCDRSTPLCGAWGTSHSPPRPVGRGIAIAGPRKRRRCCLLESPQRTGVARAGTGEGLGGFSRD